MTLHTLRRTIPDATLLDWLELLQETPGTFTAAQLRAHWQLSQPAACRRIQRLQRQARRAEQSSAQTFDDLVRIGARRGMSNPRGWARHVLKARAMKPPRASRVRSIA